MDRPPKHGEPAPDQETCEVDVSPNVNAPEESADLEVMTFFKPIWGADADGNLSATHFICDLHERKFNHRQVTVVSTAIQQALTLSSSGKDVYFACAEFEVGKARKGENAIGAYSFWIDVDVGLAKAAEKKGYISKEVALAAIVNFCASTNLPEPSIIVCSGYGLHCYWHFAQMIAADEWCAVANKLKMTTKRHGLLVDPSRTADIASVLRVPGTQNWKAPENPKQVTILRFGASIDFATFNSALEVVGAQKGGSQSGDAGSNVENYPPSSAKRIIDKCPTLAFVAEKGGAVSEPLWRLAIGVLKHTEEGAAYCHEISKGDPRYDYDETQGKIDLWKTPPSLCSSFRDQPEAKCVGCTAQCKTPIQLGHADNADPLQVAMKEMDRRYFVARVGGKVFVFDENDKEILSGGMTFQAFKQLYAGYRVDDKQVADLWLSSSKRRTYDGLVFDPSGKTESNFYNIWTGLAHEPMQGQCGLILAHIRDVWCGGDVAQYEYVIMWMALLIQMPWIKPGTALVLKSVEGTGKTSISDLLLKCLGQHAFTTAQKDQVAGHFNGHLFNKVLIVLEEAFFAGDPAAGAAVKALITNEYYCYESKGKDPITGRNYAHMIFLTNHDWAVPANGDARRWMALEVSDVHKGDHSYFNALHQEIENGGAEAFLDHLFSIDLTGFNPRVFPRTKALQEQQVETLMHSNPVAAWWLYILSEGQLDFEGWETEVSAYKVENSYKDAVKGVRNAPPWHVAAKEWKKLLPPGKGGKKRKSRPGHGREFVYILPDLKSARQFFLQKKGVDPTNY